MFKNNLPNPLCTFRRGPSHSSSLQWLIGLQKLCSLLWIPRKTVWSSLLLRPLRLLAFTGHFSPALIPYLWFFLLCAVHLHSDIISEHTQLLSRRQLCPFPLEVSHLSHRAAVRIKQLAFLVSSLTLKKKNRISTYTVNVEQTNKADLCSNSVKYQWDKLLLRCCFTSTKCVGSSSITRRFRILCFRVWSV